MTSALRGLPLSMSAKFLDFWTPPPPVRTSVRLFVHKIGRFLRASAIALSESMDDNRPPSFLLPPFNHL